MQVRARCVRDCRQPINTLTPQSSLPALTLPCLRNLHRCQSTIHSLASCPKPVISAVHSACVGGGVDLVCATDIRLASSDAWFSIKEVSLLERLGVLLFIWCIFSSAEFLGFRCICFTFYELLVVGKPRSEVNQYIFTIPSAGNEKREFFFLEALRAQVFRILPVLSCSPRHAVYVLILTVFSIAMHLSKLEVPFSVLKKLVTLMLRSTSSGEIMRCGIISYSPCWVIFPKSEVKMLDQFRFCALQVDLGICADLGTLQRLPKLIGSDSLARELVFTARKWVYRLFCFFAVSCEWLPQSQPMKWMASHAIILGLFFAYGLGIFSTVTLNQERNEAVYLQLPYYWLRLRATRGVYRVRQSLCQQ